MRLSLRSLATFALIGTAAAVPAFAQSNAGDATQSQYPACTAKPSQADTDAAHGAYMAGKGSFDEADYATAINYFKDAYRRDCTKNDLLVIIARAYELQGNRREAVHALETFLERVPTAQDAEVQKRHIANLKREIAEQAAASASASASAPPSASASAPASASAAPTESAPAPSASAPPPTAPASAGGHSIAPWILIIGGGVAVVTGGVLYGVGGGQVSSAEQNCGSLHQCPAGPSQSSEISQGNSGRTNETIGVTVGSVGLAAVVAGVVWHFVEPTDGKEQPKSGRTTLTPQVGPGYGGLGLAGTF
jgi:hypothetical protein